MSGRYLKDFAVRPDLRLRSTSDRKEQVRALAPKAAARASRQASDQRRKLLAMSSPAKWLLWVYDLTSCGESILQWDWSIGSSPRHRALISD